MFFVPDGRFGSSPNDKECSSGDDNEMSILKLVKKYDHEDDFCQSSEADAGDDEVAIIDFNAMNDDLQKFLHALSNTNAASSSSTDGRDSTSPVPCKGAVEDKKMVVTLRKERAAMVDSMAKYYLSRLCFDGGNANLPFSARSSNINQERHQMWKHIAKEVNKKYQELIGALTVEQTKKLFSNLKRKSRAKKAEEAAAAAAAAASTERAKDGASPEEEPMDDDLSIVRGAIARDSEMLLDSAIKSMVSLQPDLFRHDTSASPSIMSVPTSTKTTSKEKESGLQTDSLSSFTTSSQQSDSRLEELLRGLDKTMEINQLKEQLAEKDAQIEKLRRRVEEQAEDYRKRTQSMLDLVRIAVDRKAAADVQTFLRL